MKLILNHSICFFFPSKDRDGKPIRGRWKHLQEVRNFLTDLNGGTTSTVIFRMPALGDWSLNGKIVEEKIDLIESFTDILDRRKKKAVLSFAEKLKNDLGQESISLRLDDKVLIV